MLAGAIQLYSAVHNESVHKSPTYKQTGEKHSILITGLAETYTNYSPFLLNKVHQASAYSEGRKCAGNKNFIDTSAIPVCAVSVLPTTLSVSMVYSTVGNINPIQIFPI